MIRDFIARVSIAIALLCLPSCQQPATIDNANSSSSSSLATRPETRERGAPVRDLTRDEAVGGHILRRHVGQTEEQLRRRLERESNITGASTYTDRATAEHTVGAAIANSRGEIKSWLSRSGRHPNLVLDYDSDVPIGRTMNRGEYQSHVCQHAVVVLKYNGPDSYFVLTSYPECR